MKRFIALLLASVICISLSACGGVKSNTTLGVGDTFIANGVSFTLHDFCFAERTDHETYDPNMIDGASWGANDGYILGYLNYTIENNAKEKFNHFLDLDISIEYEDGYTFGKDLGDYKVACTETDKYNVDIEPLMKKTYHHIISTCPDTMASSGKDIKIAVTIDKETIKFLIPAADIIINEGQEAPKEEIGFIEADTATSKALTDKLVKSMFSWNSGNVKCTLSFTETHAKLTQTLAGTNYIREGEYVVGAELIKVNYGQGDVYYGWKDTGEHIELSLIE